MIDVYRISNVDRIKQILLHDSIVSRLVEPEHVEEFREKFSPMMTQNIIYYICELNGEPFGCIMLIKTYPNVWKIHVNFIEEFRDFALMASKKVFSDIKKQNPEVFRLWAEIPVLFKDVMGFARKFGFRAEGTLRNHYPWKGEMHNVIVFGMLMSEAETNDVC